MNRRERQRRYRLVGSIRNDLGAFGKGDLDSGSWIWIRIPIRIIWLEGVQVQRHSLHVNCMCTAMDQVVE